MDGVIYHSLNVHDWTAANSLSTTYLFNPILDSIYS